MRQAFHIFRKDLYRLWPQVLAVVVATQLYAFYQPGVRQPWRMGTPIAGYVALLAVWLLIARAVHEENQAGSDEYWLTRPYSRGSILSAKLLLIFSAAMLPLLAADCIILAKNHLDVWANFRGLVEHQVAIAGWLVLPPLAIATITRGVVDDFLVWLAVGFIMVTRVTRVDPLAVMTAKYPLRIAALLLMFAIWRQYHRRGHRVSLVLLLLALFLPVVGGPKETLFALEQARARQAPGTDAVTVAGSPVEITPRGCAEMPLSWTNLRPEWRVELVAEKSVIAGRSNSRWRSGSWGRPFPVRHPRETMLCQAWDSRYAGTTVRLNISLILALIVDDPPQTMPLTLAPMTVPGGGVCQVEPAASLGPALRGYVLGCQSPVWSRQVFHTAIQAPVGRRQTLGNGAGVPWEWIQELSPVSTWIANANDEQIRTALNEHDPVEFTPRTPVGLLRRDFTVSAYMSPKP